MSRATTALSIAARSVAVPVLLGARWLRPPDPREGVPIAPPGLGLSAKVLADEIFLARELLMGAILGPEHRSRVRTEIASALRYYEDAGFLARPARYHATPPPLTDVGLSEARAFGLDYHLLSFESGWSARDGEPGAARYATYDANRRAHVRLLAHAGEPRPWIVCTPGFRMGRARVDFAGFNARWLHRDLGLNVAIPVLPFHGPRQVGRRGGDGFLTGDALDTIHAQAQAVWDVRRLIGWLRSQGAPGIGLYGVSLGACTAGLVAGLEPTLDCVIAGIPASDWVSLVRGHAPALVVRASERLGFPWEELEQIFRLASPLALEPRVPRERSFVFAGISDRLAPPDQAVALWRHWREPRIAWYPGSHVSFLVEAAVTGLIQEALQTTGLVGPSRVPRRARSAFAI